MMTRRTDGRRRSNYLDDRTCNDLIGPNLVERIHAPHTERGGRSSLRQGVRGCKVTVNQLKDTIAEMFVEA